MTRKTTTIKLRYLGYEHVQNQTPTYELPIIGEIPNNREYLKNTKQILKKAYPKTIFECLPDSNIFQYYFRDKRGNCILLTY